jgi:hypothetical protein
MYEARFHGVGGVSLIADQGNSGVGLQFCVLYKKESITVLRFCFVLHFRA